MEEEINKCLDKQRTLIGEREELIGIIEKGNEELKQIEAECVEFYKTHPDYCDNDSQSLVTLFAVFDVPKTRHYKLLNYLQDSKDYEELKKNSLKITDREQKLLAEMAQLNLLDDPRFTVSNFFVHTYFSLFEFDLLSQIFHKVLLLLNIRFIWYISNQIFIFDNYLSEFVYAVQTVNFNYIKYST